jgi:LuxR family maltose regulon positive regulatory protein
MISLSGGRTGAEPHHGAYRPAASPRRPAFARTKLHPPRPRGDLLPRPRLAQALRLAVGSARLALVSAPAGSGKTTLIAQALAPLGPAPRSAEPPQAAPRTPPAPPVAWLSLDERDDDLPRFLHALVAALQHVAPGSGEEALAILDAAQAPDEALAAQVVEALVNDLLEALPGPAALVLDDLHLLAAPAIYAALELLVDLLPPAMTVVVAARHDPPLPLARWRVRGELAEVRFGDLRFSPAEAAALIEARTGAPLERPQIEALHRRTEGWAAGLGLLVASLERIASGGERARFLAGVERLDRSLYDYLAAEVLERQDPFVRMFLIETAVLQDLTPALCAAVTGRGDAEQILDELYRRNLFLVELEPGAARGPGGQPAPTYRYHDLFRQFLRERLRREAPEWAARLERRAAAAAASLGAAPAPARLPLAPQPAPMAEPLTAREIEVLALLAAGHSNQAIAERLVISLHTAKRHVANILEKLGAASRTEAAARARALGLA